MSRRSHRGNYTDNDFVKKNLHLFLNKGTDRYSLGSDETNREMTYDFSYMMLALTTLIVQQLECDRP